MGPEQSTPIAPLTFNLMRNGLTKLQHFYLATGLAVLSLVLIFGLALEIEFSYSFVGEGPLLGLVAKATAATAFAALLFACDRQTWDALQKIRFTLLVLLLAGVFFAWSIPFTNRWNLASHTQNYYSETVTLFEQQPRYTGRFGLIQKNGQPPPPAYYQVEVAHPNGKHYKFRTRSAYFSDRLLGKPVVLPLVRGRWGQDFLALPK
ncbi:MAG: hypothetical protein HC821_05555 [Lewinella sp.]|nr:hypothetical protein [Lewinella sp.]